MKVTFRKATKVPVFYDGRAVGFTWIPAGNSAEVVSIDTGTATILVGKTPEPVSIEATDLADIAKNEIEKPAPVPPSTNIVNSPVLPAATPQPVLAPGPNPAGLGRVFVHPGGLHTLADLDRMKEKVAAGEHPWIDGWNLLITDGKAQNTYVAHPQEHMISRQSAQNDATAAYLNALRWYISGDTSYADCAVRILNGWSSSVKEVPYGPDQPGLGGISMGTFALAAEVLRVYPGWKQADQETFKHMLRTYFYPACNMFLIQEANKTHFWANWYTCNILAITAIGVFCDDEAIFDQGVAAFKDGEGTGSISRAVTNLYPGGLGQWQESGRDQAHAFGGQGLLAEMCQVAWNQKVDLFSYSDNRLLAGAEYVAQYTQWKSVPFTFYTNENNANQFYISANYHGRLGNCQYFELLYNHYVVLKGLSAPNVKRFTELLRPEGGNADIVGYGTLTYTLDAKASPYPPSPVPPVPMDLTATAGLGRVDLKWSPSGAYSTQGYSIMRSTASGGPYSQVFSTKTNTSPHYADLDVTNGTTYYYVVSAINQSGTSGNSAPASATPVGGEALAAGWSEDEVGSAGVTGSAAYASAANTSLALTGGGSLGGAEDDCHFAYRKVSGDFTITARLISNVGKVDKAGLQMRESLQPGAKTVALTLGEVGGREARFRTRTEDGAKMSVQLGCDYTWIPVWFRLQRVGDTFTASQSSDGIAWFTVGTSPVTMGASYLVGVVTTSGQKTGDAVKTNFDNVMMEVAPPPGPSAPTMLAVTSPGSGDLKLTWTNHATNQIGVKVECSTDKVNFYEIADLAGDATSFVNTGLSPSVTYSYRVRAYNTGGYSSYTDTASFTLTPPVSEVSGGK